MGETAHLEPDDERGDDTVDRYTVRSVARAMKLIELVANAPKEGLQLSDLARDLAASKSTTLALARTLIKAGMLRDARPGPRYFLGTALIRLGDITRSQLALGDICRPVLAQLAGLTKMTSRVAIYDAGYPVFIERVDGPGSVRFYSPLGQREAPHASAAGKAMLATLTEDQVRAICADHGLPSKTGRTITDIGLLLDSLTTVRSNGFAIDDEEDAEGIFCVGAAFFGHDGACAGAVSVTGIKSDLPTWRVNELGRTVRRAADQVTRLLSGGRYASRTLAAGALA
ncbi:MAG TPA: IclR family transcriptional regulator [Streptosporangiaceae bacterium]|nr:IclR family transcriptional regulator [Streptosporangiaceae bacterium]